MDEDDDNPDNIKGPGKGGLAIQAVLCEIQVHNKSKRKVQK